MSRLRPPSLPLRAPNLNQLQIGNLLIPGVIGLALIVPALMFLAGVGVRQGVGTPLVINEVYLDQTASKGWIELLNTTEQTITLNGMTLGSSRGVQARLEGDLPPGELRTFSPEVGGWNPKGDVAVLRDQEGEAIDSVNWGAVAAAPAGVKLLARVPPGRSGGSLTRNPQGLDSDLGADWVPTPPSRGTRSPASLPVGLHRILFAATNYMSVIAGFLLWGAFLLIGLIAQRFEVLTGQRVYWLAMVAVPVGIVIYNVIQAYAFFTAGSMTNCSTGLSFARCQQGWAFVPILISAIAMTFIVYRFYNIARNILDLKEA